MKNAGDMLQKMVSEVPKDVMIEADLTFAISNRINELMQQRGLSKKQFAEALGKKPSEVTKWLCGQHNFTIRTIAMLSAFFGETIIAVPKPYVFEALPDRCVADSVHK